MIICSYNILLIMRVDGRNNFHCKIMMFSYLRNYKDIVKSSTFHASICKLSNAMD